MKGATTALSASAAGDSDISVPYLPSDLRDGRMLRGGAKWKFAGVFGEFTNKIVHFRTGRSRDRTGADLDMHSRWIRVAC